MTRQDYLDKVKILKTELSVADEPHLIASIQDKIKVAQHRAEMERIKTLISQIEDR